MKIAKPKLRSCAIVVAVFGVLYLLGHTCLRNVYLFEWTARNNYLFIWVVALAAALDGAAVLSYAITLGNVVGILFGQFFGDFLVAQKVAKLAPDASSDMRSWAYLHHGAFLWLGVVLAFFLGGLVLNWWVKKRQHPAPM